MINRILFLILGLAGWVHAQTKAPSAYQIHQRFQQEKRFQFVSASESYLRYRPSQDFDATVVPTDSAGQLVLNTWPKPVMEHPELLRIRQLMREGKFNAALTPLEAYAKKHKGVAPIQLLLAEVLFQEWNNARSERIVDSLLMRYPLYAFGYSLKAELLLRAKKVERAMEMAARARVLQAASASIIGTFEAVMARAGLKNSLTLIKPNFHIEFKDSLTVLVADPLWSTYAMCRCLWENAPAYPAERGGKPGKKFDMQREQECILAMISQGETSTEWLETQEMQLMRRAKEKDMLQEFIMMELFLPMQPALAFSMKPAQRQQLEKYLLEVRVQP